MHIKQVLIEGFKSYKDQTLTDEFDRHINVVVGANGSGKSNFFHAIRFVLNDAFINIRGDERLQLLHEGAGQRVTSAWVEVVFDNEDGRFPIDKTEIRLRRTISAKKDEYTLDRKHINKAEVSNLLESAGFSKCNPYYIVQQGKITAMAQMRDEQRLELLKEIGGTRVYEERRKESLRLMADTDSRNAQIKDMLADIQEKLRELDTERAELVEYQALDKRKRCIQYVLYDKELAKARSDLDKLERDAQNAREAAVNAASDHDRNASELADIERKIKSIQGDLTVADKQAADLKAQKAKLVTDRARADMELRDVEQNVKDSETSRTSMQDELVRVKEKVAEEQQKIGQRREAVTSQMDLEAAAKARVAEVEAQLAALYRKEGGQSRYRTKEERDAALKKEISDMEMRLEAQRQHLQRQEKDLAQATDLMLQLSQAIGDGEAALPKMDTDLASAERKLAEARSVQRKLMDERNAKARDEESREAQFKQAQDDARQAKNVFDHAMPYDVRAGLLGLQRLVREKGVSMQGVYGSLIEHIQVDPLFFNAVDVVAGNRLMDVLVEDDAVAQRLIKGLRQYNFGRCSFVPLNRMRALDPNLQAPKEFGSDVILLSRKVKHDERHARAVADIFGEVLLCKDSSVATQVCRVTDRFDCVTPSGEKIGRRGNICGGHLDVKRSKMATYKAHMDAQKRLAEIQAERDALAADIAKVQSQLDEGHQAITKLTLDVDRMRQQRKSQYNDLKQRKLEDVNHRLEVETAERAVATCASNIQSLEAELVERRRELGSELVTQLTAEERQSMTALSINQQTLREQLQQRTKARQDAENALEAAVTILAANLQKRQGELEEALSSSDVEADKAMLPVKKAEAASLRASLDEVTRSLAEIQERCEVLRAEQQQLTKRRDEIKEASNRKTSAAEDHQKALEALDNKRAGLIQRQSDLERKIRDLGSLPQEAFDKQYKDQGFKDLVNALSQVNGSLERFSGVNRNALDQYMSFTQQRDELVARLKEQEASESKIRELIQALDMRKDEAIERTFKGVAKNFREVFADLVPGGAGELVMIRAAGRQADDNTEGEAAQAGHSTSNEKYSGVKVRVKFAGAGEAVSMRSLSGGQKTLVALALIFAIQRCDPAPFYLFDEIDAALDPQYRTTVAKMLSRQATDSRNPAQFIVTTFHPQILTEANKIFGVSHTNRISRVFVITNEQAMEFLQVEEPPANAPAGKKASRKRPAAQEVHSDDDGAAAEYDG